MNVSLILACCLWVIAGTVTAFLPMRRQMIPGLTLIVTAPVLLIWIGSSVGWVWAATGVFAFASMFRNPLIYFYKRARGIEVEIPKEFRE